MPMGAEIDSPAVVVDDVVALVGVEAELVDMLSINVAIGLDAVVDAVAVAVLSAVVGGRLVQEHFVGTVEQFCKWLSGAGEQIKNLTMSVCERELCKCGEERKHGRMTNAPGLQRNARRREIARQKG